MSGTTRDGREWEIGPATRRTVDRERDGRLTVPLQITHHGALVATAPLRLTVADAEHLHASLCRALDKEPAPADAPDCRKPIQYPGGRQRF